MKVRIAFATKPDGTVDADRIGTVEDHPDADAKRLIKDGIAAPATDQDIADWESTQAHRRQVAEAETGISPVETPEQAQPPRKQRRNRVSGQLEDVDYANGGLITESGSAGDDQVPAALGGHPPIVTVAPGAESSPDVDPADRDK